MDATHTVFDCKKKKETRGAVSVISIACTVVLAIGGGGQIQCILSPRAMSATIMLHGTIVGLSSSDV